MPLTVSKLDKFMKLITKNAKKTVKVSVEDKLYGIRTFRDKQEIDILEIRGYKEGFTRPDYKNDNFLIHIEYGEDLKLSKFRKIIKNLVSSKNNVLKVSIKEELYDIQQIKDREDVLIFVVCLKEEPSIDQ